MPAGRRADPGPVSRPGACPRQVVHGRHPLPPADPEGRGDGRRRRPLDGLAAAPPFRQRAHPRGQPRAGAAHPGAVHRHRDPARRHGPHGDRHPGDHPVAGPDLLQRAGRSRHRHRAGHQRQHRRDLRQAPRPLCRARHGAVPGAGTGGRGAEPTAQIAGAARHRDRHQRRRRRSVGAALPPDLRPRRGIGPGAVHAPDRLSRRPAASATTTSPTSSATRSTRRWRCIT